VVLCRVRAAASRAESPAAILAALALFSLMSLDEVGGFKPEVLNNRRVVDRKNLASLVFPANVQCPCNFVNALLTDRNHDLAVFAGVDSSHVVSPVVLVAASVRRIVIMPPLFHQ
jgi:hypothetical protein